MAARPDILEKVKKSKEDAQKRLSEARRTSDFSAKSIKPIATKPTASVQTSWHKSSMPTEAETLAQIYRVAQQDQARGEQALSLYNKAKSEGAWNEPYSKPTTQYGDLVGINPITLNDDNIKSLAPYLQGGVLTSTGSLSSAKKNGTDAQYAYNLSGLMQDYESTKAYLAEQDEIVREAQYWIRKGLSDDEIKAKLNIGGEGTKYTKIKNAIDKAKVGEVVRTTSPLWAATSYGIDSMLWGLRNPDQTTGDKFYDAVQMELGRGNAYVRDEERMSRLDATSEKYNPYMVGTTMDDLAIKYGVDQFDDQWLQQNRGMRNDPKLAGDYSRIYNAHENTLVLQQEVDAFRSALAEYAERGVQPDYGDLFEEGHRGVKFDNLKKLVESLKSGKLYDTTAAIDFDLKALMAETDAAVKLKQAQTKAATDLEAAEELAGAEKQNWWQKKLEDVESWWQNLTTPEETIAPPTPIIEETPAEIVSEGEAMFEPVVAQHVAEGDYNAAADEAMQEYAALLEQNPELLTTDDMQKGALFLLVAANEAGWLTDPAAQEKANSVMATVEASMGIEPEAAETKTVWSVLYNLLTGGELGKAQVNEGIGPSATLMLLWDRAMARGADIADNAVGAVISGLGELLNNEWMINYGKDSMAHYDEVVAHYDQYLNDHGTPLENIAAKSGSEVVHMAQLGSLSKIASTYKTVKAGKGAEFLTKVLMASPFALEAGGAEFQETYAETDNYTMGLAAGAAATAITSLLSQWDGILRNIEANGMPYLPAVVEALGSVPGSGVKAGIARWGKAFGMWMLNGLKTIANEGVQEAVEGGATDIVVNLIKGKNLSDVDWAQFGKDRAADAVGAVVLSLGSAVSTMPAYARSVKVYESQALKSELTAKDVDTFVSAVQADMQDPEIVRDMQERALNIAVETRTGELIAEGAMDSLDSSAVEDAQTKLADTEAALAEANTVFNANPADDAAKNEVLRLIKERDAARAEAEKVQADYDAAAAELMNTVREQARAEVTQNMAAVQEARMQQEAAAEVKRQNDNVAALEANDFIDETNPDVNDEEFDAVQQTYISTVGENSKAAPAEQIATPVDRNAVEFVTKLSKLFKVKFNFVEGDDGFEGKYSNGVVTINKKTTQGEAIRKVALHELIHHVEKTGEYKTLVSLVKDYFFKDEAGAYDMDAYDKEVEDLRQLYESRKDALGIKEDIDYAYGERELVAEYAARIFADDEQFIERIVTEKPSLAVRIAEALKGIVDKLRGVNDPELDMIRNAEKAFRKALEKSADPRARSLQQVATTSEHPNAEQFSISQFARAAGLQMRTNSEGAPYTIVDANGNEVKNVTADMIKVSPMGKLIATAQNSGTIDADTAQKQYDMFAELMTMVAEYKDQAMIWEIAGSELFSAIKSNSDTQYSTTVDFGTICSKTREVVNVMSETMLKKGRGLTREEVIDAYSNTHKAGMAVPCPVCYVFSRWMGVPSLLETMRKGQERFANATDADVNAYLKSVAEKYGIEGKELSESVGKAKTKVQNKLKKISESLLKDVFKNAADKTDLIEQAKALEAELDEIEMFNWVNQVLCKTDSKRKPILDKDGNVTIDPSYKAVPNEVLLDLRRTGEFASDYAKAWTFRTTRGAGMGKAILPYSGAELGDTISGVKRWSASQNPYFTGNDKEAARKMKFAQIRAKAQNLIGGQRFQSTSDYRPEWGLDYLSTFLEMQAIGAKGQLYTKVIEAVDMFATAGIEVNMSIMPKDNGYHLDENGNPVLGEEDFSDVTGISFKGALEKTQKYDNAQMILVGINDTHIELAMADDRISFIIPWHSSGNSKDTLTTLMNAVGESLTNAEDYTDIQTDKPSANQTPEQKAMWDLRMEILTGKLKRGVSDEQQKLLDSNPYLKAMYEKFYVDESATDTYGVKLSKAQAGQIFPHEYWDTSLTIDQADGNGRRFVEYCATMGIDPRFGKFSDKPGYWKLLIDRRMYNRDGTYHVPQTIDVTKVDIADVAAEVSQAKVGTPEQISKAVQGTIDDINARLPAEPFDMQADVDIDADNSEGQYSIPSDDVLKRQVRSWRSGRSEELNTDQEYTFSVHPVKSSPASIDDYDQRSYYHGGWARANNVISKVENSRFKSYALEVKLGRAQPPQEKTADGFYVYATYSLDEKQRSTGDNVLLVTDMNGENPSIERAYRIGYRHEDTVKDVRDRIYEIERDFGGEALQAVRDYFPEEMVGAYTAADWPSYSDLRERRNAGRGGSLPRENGIPDSGSDYAIEGRVGSGGSIEGTGGQYSVNTSGILTRRSSETQLTPAPNDIIPNAGEQEQNFGNGERQFAGQTIQNSTVVPDWVKQEFLRPEELNYEVDTNREQVERSWQRIQENGYEAERDRLLSLDRYSADDTTEANLMMAMALREDTADPATFMALASHYNKEGTKAGQELQARKLFTRMSPTGARVWAAGQMESNLEEHMRTHQPQRRRVDENARRVADQIRDLQGGDEILRLNAGGDFTIDESNNRWGIPINEQQQALIDHYGLNNVGRPGIFYNRATTRQRMLEAILAMPNPLEVTGLGLNLIQRLEFMRDGEAVITNADLNYIGTQLGQFVALGEEAGGRAADLALARAYEAFSNITPATRMEKFRTQRYVNMLSTFTSFARNIIGNVGQNVANAAAHGIAVEIDRLTSLGTGRRTMAHLSAAERIEGWRAFAEETRNTFLDFFVDRANTAPNRDRYSTNQRGRVFQNGAFEMSKDIESFLMSVGDRNIWRKAFVNSLAEQQKLADRNQLFNDDGTTRTHEQMVEHAEAAANYATFTEDSLAQDIMQFIRQRNPVAADVLGLYMPFTGVPHNIMKRNFQYSPIGFLTMAGRMAANRINGRNFDQNAFVNDLSRALTGTGGVIMGVVLGLAGAIKMGTEDEQKDKVYDVETALGEQYTPYVYDPTTDTYVSMSTFAPAASPLVWGAAIGQQLKNDEFNSNVLLSALSSSVDSIFDASYLSGLSDLFGGYGSFTENLAHVTAENLASQLTPAFLNQVANAMDPYVRDTKDKDYLTELMKTTLNRIPLLRNQLLPEKVTVAGENVMTKQGWSLVDPFTRTNTSDNAALIEVKRLYDVIGDTAVLPSDALRSRKNSLTLNKKSVTLNDQQKAEYKKYYGDLWTSEVSALMATPAYQLMDDEERAAKVEKIMTDALKRAKKEFIERYGE